MKEVELKNPPCCRCPHLHKIVVNMGIATPTQKRQDFFLPDPRRSNELRPDQHGQSRFTKPRAQGIDCRLQVREGQGPSAHGDGCAAIRNVRFPFFFLDRLVNVGRAASRAGTFKGSFPTRFVPADAANYTLGAALNQLNFSPRFDYAPRGQDQGPERKPSVTNGPRTDDPPRVAC